MADDLVKRLRNEKMGCNLWCEYYDGITTIPLCIEAADHIEKLEAALRALIEANDNSWHPMEINGAEWFTARQALEGKDE